MKDFIIVDALTDLSALEVSRFAKAIPVDQCEIEIGLLQGQTHGGKKGFGSMGGAFNRRELLPKVI